MKIVCVKISGQPKVGDTIMVHYSAPRGGRTTAGHIVGAVEETIDAETFRRRPETPAEIVDSLVKSARGQFCGWSDDKGFKVHPRGDIVRIECPDVVADVAFCSEVRTADGSEPSFAVEITEF